MRRPGGYVLVTHPDPGFLRLDRGGRIEEAKEGFQEFDTFTCGHCSRVQHVRARENPEDTGGLCKQCMKLICPRCVNSGKCDPLEKKLERAEARDIALRSYGF